jgi:hypothetical protein
MKNRYLTRGALGVALLLSCTPTEPCACPPARTSLVLYGEVRTADGAPAAGATLQYLIARPNGAAGGNGSLCQFDAATNDADPAGASSDAAGRFRTQVFSVSAPDTHCLRVSAFGPAGSAQVEDLIVFFRLTRPDSLGLVLTLR